ncbi:TlpA disulfide reductase family protein [Pedobacter aquatilis]|uniref:TlpA family protein disulfide reductase n=1 Tax=Pedobacter aquatilis TaxID=351343 RepID=UPI0025B48772|nr:TlpA disulfide reductase family protein [Pedobacter aquatilis]MDN3587669.1 TlpA disulfide reductase family protein [Pedobacter aquatilis]
MIFIKKNIVNILLIAFLLLVIFVPDAKAFLIKGLMEIGLYSPKIENTAPVEMDLSGINFSNVKGEKVDLNDLKGKVIFINFWATWCPPCRAEMPSINKLYNQFKNDKELVFLFVDADSDLPKSQKFMTDRKYELPLYKSESEIPQQIFSGSLPTTVIFDKQGRLSFRHEGIANYGDKKFVSFLNELKQQSK